MSRKREIEGRLALYSDLKGIVAAMRSFALVELRRVSRREVAQSLAKGVVETALGDLRSVLPQPAPVTGDIWLLFGSVRGFCGSFNEDVLRAWQDHDSPTPMIACGEHLVSLLSESREISAVAGANGALDAATTIDRILTEIDTVRLRSERVLGLMAVVHDDAGVTIQRLLPLPEPLNGRRAELPLTYEPAQKVAGEVVGHYLFHVLMAMLLRSIRIENHMRLMQMENALTYLQEGEEDLGRQRNRLRQEEIVEEIELIAGGANSGGFGSNTF
ncbi:MAG: F0F1 ATP synthase subunit gamma [Rhizobium sp.]